MTIISTILSVAPPFCFDYKKDLVGLNLWER